MIVDLRDDGTVALADRNDAIRPGNAKRSDIRKLLNLAADHFEELVALWETCMATRQHKVVTTNKQIDAALARAKEFEAVDRRVSHACFDRLGDRITLSLTDGVEVSIPRRHLQGLQDASPAQLAKIEVLGRGTGLRWPRLDVDHYVPGLLHQVFGTRQWMSRLGRLGGSSKSAAKTAAARRNGRKGGRPRKSSAAASA